MMDPLPTTWEIWTYDVWGNASDGYEVNDRSCLDRGYHIDATQTRYNVDFPADRQFVGAALADEDICEALGFDGDIDVDGDDMAYYVNRTSDGYPLAELHCTSHESLSPIGARIDGD